MNTPNGHDDGEEPKVQDDQMDDILLQPITYLEENFGDLWDKKFLKCLNFWLKVPEEAMVVINDILKREQYISAAFNDMQIGQQRRGTTPTAHTIFGLPFTIMSAFYAQLKSTDKVRTSPYPEILLPTYVKELREISRVEAQMVHWTTNGICPLEEEYIEILQTQTAGIALLALALMQLFRKENSDKDFTKLIRLIGRYQAIKEECIDMQIPKSKDKDFGRDITQGKFNLSIMHATRTQPQDIQIQSILRQKTDNVGKKKFVIDLLEKFGSLEYVQKMLAQTEMEIRCELRKFDHNPKIDSYLEHLLLDDSYFSPEN